MNGRRAKAIRRMVYGPDGAAGSKGRTYSLREFVYRIAGKLLGNGEPATVTHVTAKAEGLRARYQKAKRYRAPDHTACKRAERQACAEVQHAERQARRARHRAEKRETWRVAARKAAAEARKAARLKAQAEAAAVRAKWEAAWERPSKAAAS